MALRFCILSSLSLACYASWWWGHKDSTTTQIPNADIHLIPTNATWSHFIYMVADNEVMDNFAPQDVADMLRTPDYVNIVVYIDRTNHVGEQATISNIIDCETQTAISGTFNGSKILQKHKEQGGIAHWCQIYDFNHNELSSLDPENLRAFVELMGQHRYWAQLSDYFALTLWGHGAAWRGLGGDTDMNGVRDSLNLVDLFNAIETGYIDFLGRLDILGFDASLMADYAVLTDASYLDIASLLILSPSTEPDNGWNYSALGADDYYRGDQSEKRHDPWPYAKAITANVDYPLTIFDIDKTEEFLSLFTTFIRQVTLALSYGDYGMLMAVLRGESGTFPIESNHNIQDLGFWLANIIDKDNVFWNTCSQRIKAAANKTLTALLDIYSTNTDEVAAFGLTGSAIFYSTNLDDIETFIKYNPNLGSSAYKGQSNYVEFLKQMNATLTRDYKLTNDVCQVKPPTDTTFQLNDEADVSYYPRLGLYKMQWSVTSTVMKGQGEIWHTYVPIATVKGYIWDKRTGTIEDPQIETTLELYWDGRVGTLGSTLQDPTDFDSYIVSMAEIGYLFHDEERRGLPYGYVIKYPVYILSNVIYSNNVTQAKVANISTANGGYVSTRVLLGPRDEDEVSELQLYEISSVGDIYEVPVSDVRILRGLDQRILQWPYVALTYQPLEVATLKVEAYDVFGANESVEMDGDDLLNATVVTTPLPTANPAASSTSSTGVKTPSPTTSTTRVRTPSPTKSTTSTTRNPSTASTASSATSSSTEVKSKAESTKGLSTTVWIIIIAALAVVVIVLIVLFVKTKRDLNASRPEQDASYKPPDVQGYIQMSK
eukprot:99404_1